MSRSNAVLIALAGLLVLASGAPAAAQSLSDLGDFSALLGSNRLHFGFGGTAAYETNVVHASSDLAAQERGLTPADEIYTPSANVDVQQNIGAGIGALTGSASYNFYSHNKQLDRENIAFSGLLQQQVGVCQGDLKVNFSRALNQLVDVTLQQIEETYTQATVGGDATCGHPVGLAPTVSLSESWGNNSEGSLSIGNSQTFRSSGGLTYRTAAQGALTVTGIFQQTQFPDANPLLEIGKGGYTVTGATVQYEREIGARIQGGLSATYTSVQADAAPGFTGLTYAVNLSYRAGSRLNFSGSFTRQVIPSNLVTASYRVENDSSVHGAYNVSSRLNWTLGASQQVGNEYGGISLGQLTHYDQQSIFSSLTLSLHKLTLSLNVRNDHRTTNATGLSYYDTRAALQVGTRF